MSSAKCQMLKEKETHLCIVSFAMNSDCMAKILYLKSNLQKPNKVFRKEIEISDCTFTQAIS